MKLCTVPKIIWIYCMYCRHEKQSLFRIERMQQYVLYMYVHFYSMHTAHGCFSFSRDRIGFYAETHDYFWDSVERQCNVFIRVGYIL